MLNLSTYLVRGELGEVLRYSIKRQGGILEYAQEDG